MTTLEATGIDYAIGDRTILSDVSLRAGAGQVFGVVGPSGAGKSSLLGVLSGLLAPTAGSVSIDGIRVTTDDTKLRRSIGLVLQGYGLVAALTGRENVAVTLRARGVNAPDADRLATDTLAALGLAEVADHLIDDLSGGQQQRVAVARGLAGDPEIIIADEPTSELDAENRRRVFDLLTAAARRGALVVVAAHDPELVERCDNVLHIDPYP